jgi:hypothetical protein
MATVRGILKLGLLEWKKAAKVQLVNLQSNGAWNYGKKEGAKIWKLRPNFMKNWDMRHNGLVQSQNFKAHGDN